MSRSAFIKFIALCSLPLCLVAVLLAGGFHLIGIEPGPQVSAAQASPATLADRSISNMQLTGPMPSLTDEKAVEYLKHSGMDRSLYEAVSAARHQVVNDREKLIAFSEKGG